MSAKGMRKIMDLMESTVAVTEEQITEEQISEDQVIDLTKETELGPKDKLVKVAVNRRGRTTVYQGTLSQLIDAFRYTLETGASYQNEKGNKKINLKPTNAESLVKNLNAAENNAAANGYSETYYSIVL